MKLYHSTLKENISSILKEGLKPSKIGIVYLSESPNSWWTDHEHTILEVDMTNYQGKLTTFGISDLDEILCWGFIEPERIREYKL